MFFCICPQINRFVRWRGIDSEVGLACAAIPFIMILQTIAPAYYNDLKHQKHE
jgi:hypothetical protein